MITDLLGRFPVNADDSILIGDKPSDLEAARAAGLQGHLFSGGNLEAFVRMHLPRPARLRAIAGRAAASGTSDRLRRMLRFSSVNCSVRLRRAAIVL